MKGEKEEEGKVMDAKNWKERMRIENKKEDRRLRKIKAKGIKTLNKESSCTRGTQAQNAEEKV